MPLQRNTSASFSRSAALTYHPDQPVPCHIRGSGERQYHFLRYIAGNFKTETEVTLFAMTAVIFKPSLTAATKVFNQCPVGGRFPQKVLAKPQAGQKTCTGTLSLLPFGVPTSGA